MPPRRRRVYPASHARVEEALRELPLADPHIVAVARQLTGNLTFYGGSYSLWNNPAFFDFRCKVTAECEHFAADGPTLRLYLPAALKQPQLFYQSPATLVRHNNTLIDMHRAGLITFRGQANAPPEQPLRPLFAFLLRRPRYLILSDDSYALRLRYARVTGKHPGTELLDLPRHLIEEELARALGNIRHGQQ